jgi:hypothetical protein
MSGSGKTSAAEQFDLKMYQGCFERVYVFRVPPLMWIRPGRLWRISDWRDEVQKGSDAEKLYSDHYNPEDWNT